ncbi:MAG: hypothetical protein SAJ37_11590 [Oscillatoria sp. PMC 1068.18]|nr:hypothetical protein [Oscillatoria sp. PMC 1076.18]MEC4989382.1 hypothetical protein [Oscillatoria sp. PMC 1068.18]
MTRNEETKRREQSRLSEIAFFGKQQQNISLEKEFSAQELTVTIFAQVNCENIRAESNFGLEKGDRAS